MVDTGLVMDEKQWRRYHLFEDYYEAEWDPVVGDPEAWHQVDGYIQALDAGHDRRGLFLTGPPGTGKTLMAHLVMSHVLEQRNAKYLTMKLDCISAVSYMDLLLSMMSTEGMIKSGVDLGERYVGMVKRLEGVEKAKWLLLDDLATEHTTEWSRNRIATLLRERGNYGKSTVMTTNLSLPAFAEAYGERTLSFIYQVCKVVEVFAEDSRRR